MHNGFWVYILASGRNATLYIGVTNNLVRREWEHKIGKGSKFVKKYGVKMVVYVEHYQYWEDAYKRESALKKWKREWKIALIEIYNPSWTPINLNL